MHQIARAAALAITTLVLGGGAELNAQVGAATPRVAALNAVIRYRLEWIGDSTPFDACSVYRRIEPREQVTSGLLPGFRDWFVASTKPCVDSGAVDRRRERRVLVDSLTLADSTGRVWVTVRRGEQTHREEYWLANPIRGLVWGVGRVVLSGATRTYFVRPDDPRPPT